MSESRQSEAVQPAPAGRYCCPQRWPRSWLQMWLAQPCRHYPEGLPRTAGWTTCCGVRKISTPVPGELIFLSLGTITEDSTHVAVGRTECKEEIRTCTEGTASLTPTSRSFFHFLSQSALSTGSPRTQVSKFEMPKGCQRRSVHENALRGPFILRKSPSSLKKAPPQPAVQPPDRRRKGLENARERRVPSTRAEQRGRTWPSGAPR